MFNNKFTKKDSVVDAVTKILSEDKHDDIPFDGPYKKSRKSPEQAMSSAHNLAGKGLKKAKSLGRDPDLKSAASKLKAKIAKEESEHSFASYLIDNYKNSQFDLDQIDEKEMTPAQNKKKEEIVLSMKDKEKEFKAKYGKRWKDVMYATATKMAMKEETLEERWDDDDEDDDVARADRELARMKAKPIKAHDKTDPDKEISKLAKKTPKEVDESVVYEHKGPESDTVPFITGANTTSSPAMKKIKEIACSAKSRMKKEMLGKTGTSESVDPNIKTTDMLRGRVKGGKSDDVGPGADFKSTKIRLKDGDAPQG